MPESIPSPASQARLSIAGVRCGAVYEPGNVEGCAELMARAARERKRLAFVGGGTSLELGNAPAGIDAAILTRRLNRVVEYAPEDQVIVVEAGVLLSDLQALAARNNQWLGVDAPHAVRATLGGLVAVGAFGPRRARYGGIKDLLLGVTLVRADGGVSKSGSKVVKNVAGFDLPKLLCGSLGTLGLIARVTLRLHPLPEASQTLVLGAVSARRVVETVRALRSAQLEPSSVVALRRAHDRYDLGVRFEGFARGVERDVVRFMELGRGGDEAPTSERLSMVDASVFWQRHEALRSEGELRFRLQLLPTQLPEAERLLAPLLSGLDAAQGAWYATLGIGFYSAAVVDAEASVTALSAARSAATALGGALVVDAAPAAIRAKLDAWGPPPNAFELMLELKKRFDPERRLNPGRFVGGI